MINRKRAIEVLFLFAKWQWFCVYCLQNIKNAVFFILGLFSSNIIYTFALSLAG